MGEYPLAWSACLCNEGMYNLLLLKGADPDAEDSYGNTVSRAARVPTRPGAPYGGGRQTAGHVQLRPQTPDEERERKYQEPPRSHLPHPVLPDWPRRNIQVKLQVLAGDPCLREMLELSCTEFWRYSNITCCGYPLGALDSIQSDGQTSGTTSSINP